MTACRSGENLPDSASGAPDSAPSGQSRRFCPCIPGVLRILSPPLSHHGSKLNDPALVRRKRQLVTRPRFPRHVVAEARCATFCCHPPNQIRQRLRVSDRERRTALNSIKRRESCSRGRPYSSAKRQPPVRANADGCLHPNFRPSAKENIRRTRRGAI